MDLRPDELETQLAKGIRVALTRTGDRHAELAAVGVLAVGAPLRWGGLELGLGADVVVLTELGRGLEPLAGARDTLLALELLAAAGDAAGPYDEVLTRAIAGTARLAVAGLRDGVVRAAAGGPGAVPLHGTGSLVEDAPLDLVLVRAEPGGWYAVPVDGDGVRSEPVSVLGAPALRLRFDGAVGYRLPIGPAATGRAIGAARIRQAALLLGISARALAVTSAHVNRRIQFDRPLVQFQSVTQRLAALVADLEGWQLLVREAAWHHDRGQGTRLAAVQVLAAAAEHALASTRTAVQLHGARGLRAGSAPALAYRLAATEALRWGPVGRLWAEAGRLRLDAVEPYGPGESVV